VSARIISEFRGTMVAANSKKGKEPMEYNHQDLKPEEEVKRVAK